MLKILVVADMHGEFEKFSKLIDKMRVHDFDLVVCPGDFTDIFNVPEGYSQLDIAELMVQKLLYLGRPVFCLPGNHEPYDILDMFEEYDTNLHDKVKKFKDFEFLGFGGAATPLNTNSSRLKRR